MGQKTHPIGFRLGVPIRSKISTKQIELGYTGKDLHGLTSRWAVSLGTSASNITETYGDLAQRDRIIKDVVEQFLEESGFTRNKCIVTRTTAYVGIYVDGLQMEEASLIRTRGILSKSSSGDVIPGNSRVKSRSTNVKEIGTGTLESLISLCVEEGKPVHIQFVNLLLSTKRKRESKISITSLRGIEVDLFNALNLLRFEKVPCCSLIAKIISQRRSTRREREALRVVNKLRTNLYVPNSKDYGLQGYLRIFKGRIGGSERSRIIRYRSGPRPRHTVSAGIDHGFAEVNTTSGKVSITIRGYLH